jgi:hypothetical protein
VDKQHTSNNEKMSDRAFSQGLLISVISILLCIVALCSVTYAWFSEETSSTENKLTSASFALEITVETVGQSEESSVGVVKGDDGKLYCELLTAGTYKITLRMDPNSTASKGYCDIKVKAGGSMGEKDVIYKVENQETSEVQGLTESIRNDQTSSFTFTITVEEGRMIEFIPKWGLPASPDIFNEGVYTAHPAQQPQN